MAGEHLVLGPVYWLKGQRIELNGAADFIFFDGKRGLIGN